MLRDKKGLKGTDSKGRWRKYKRCPFPMLSTQTDLSLALASFEEKKLIDALFFSWCSSQAISSIAVVGLAAVAAAAACHSSCCCTQFL